MTADAQVSVNGENLVALRAGALWWPARETLIVSDIHFEKGSHFATKGVHLPPYDTRSTLKRLAALIATHQPKTVISLGDAFHDGEAEARMDDQDGVMLQSLIASTRWIWILGNHDPEPPERFAGAAERRVRIGRLIFRHEPDPRPEPGEIAGHFHPVAKVRVETRLVRRRCFATDGERMIMPAFGAYAGGLNILDEAYDGMFQRGLAALMLGAAGVYRFEEDALLPDAGARRRRCG